MALILTNLMFSCGFENSSLQKISPQRTLLLVVPLELLVGGVFPVVIKLSMFKLHFSKQLKEFSSTLA